MKYNLLIILAFLIQTSLFGQDYFTRTGHVHVHSKSSFMELDADNYQMNSKFNVQTGDIMFVGLIKSFQFDLGLADRLLHNERINVIDQPKILFEGKILGLDDIDLSVPGRHLVTVKGNLYIYGYKRITSAKGMVRVSEDGTLRAESNFKMTIEKESVEKINELMRSHLPDIISVDAEELGLSRDIDVEINLEYRTRS